MIQLEHRKSKDRYIEIIFVRTIMNAMTRKCIMIQMIIQMVIHQCSRRMADVTKKQLVLIYPVVINVCAMMDGSVMEYHARLYNVQKVFIVKRKNVTLFNRIANVKIPNALMSKQRQDSK